MELKNTNTYDVTDLTSLEKLEPVLEDYHTIDEIKYCIGIEVLDKGFLKNLKRLFN